MLFDWTYRSLVFLAAAGFSLPQMAILVWMMWRQHVYIRQVDAFRVTTVALTGAVGQLEAKLVQWNTPRSLTTPDERRRIYR